MEEAPQVDSGFRNLFPKRLSRCAPDLPRITLCCKAAFLAQSKMSRPLGMRMTLWDALRSGCATFVRSED